MANRNKWWESETPEILASGRNVLRWYPRAGMLTVSKPDWVDAAGVTMTGKSVALSVAALEELDPEDLRRAIALLDAIAARLKAALLVNGTGGPTGEAPVANSAAG